MNGRFKGQCYSCSGWGHSKANCPSSLNVKRVRTSTSNSNSKDAYKLAESVNLKTHSIAIPIHLSDKLGGQMKGL